MITLKQAMDVIQSRYFNKEVSGQVNRLGQPLSPEFTGAAPSVMDSPNVNTFLYRFLPTRIGRPWHSLMQWHGTCTGQGTKTAWEDKLAIESILTLTSKFPGRVSVAGIYAGARVDVENNPGTWEGADGLDALVHLEKNGTLLLRHVNIPEDQSDTAMKADEDLAMKWTNSRDGIPSDYDKVMGVLKLGAKLSCKNSLEVCKALQNGNPVVIGSNLIPTGVRDSNGFSPVKPAGGHWTCFRAVRYDNPGVLYQQSWSDHWGSGRTFPEDMPPGSCWITLPEVDAMIQSMNRCYSLIRTGGLIYQGEIQ